MENYENCNKITKDGLFYSNFSDRFQLALATIPDSEYYSEHLVKLRDTYGITIGKPMPDSNGNLPSDSRVIGVYIVNYRKYLIDKKSELIQWKSENNIDVRKR